MLRRPEIPSLWLVTINNAYLSERFGSSDINFLYTYLAYYVCD